jgi:hypothetical protein
VLEFPPMDQEKKADPASHAAPHHPPPGAALIHRVCIQCNNMFTVDAANFEAKQCPACHKG